MGTEILVFLAVAALAACLILPVVALVRTSRIRSLENRLAGVEAALLRVMQQQGTYPAPPPPPAEPVREEPAAALPPLPEAPPAVGPVPCPPLAPAPPPEQLELVIGRRWLGWVAVVLIFGAVVFFLKYAFENRWIGELGRVALGMAAGLVLVWAGYDRHLKRWRYLSQVLTAGGVAVLYLSVYGAFGYYHLIDQRSAFVFLAVVVVEAHLLAAAYNAPPIAVMALAGGFLIPLLLSTGRDQYRVLFTYIGILDLGMLGIAVGRRWRWIGSLAFAGTHLLFWAWYAEHYHPEKRPAALLFQAAVFLLFVLADLAPGLRGKKAGWEEWIRLALNPFVFYATCYSLLNGDHHDWMAVLALLLAVAHALLARAGLAFPSPDRRTLLVTLGTALTFVTLAIPVQLESNWITIAWGLEALALLWVGLDAGIRPLRAFSAVVFSIALLRFLFEDTPWGSRALFTPVLNRYYLGMLALAVCLGGAAYLCGRPGARAGLPARLPVAVGLLAFGVFWLGSSVEAYSYFGARAAALSADDYRNVPGAARHLRWAGQLSLSLLWSACAGLLAAAGFRLRRGALRAAGLVLFGVTLAKAVLVDISELRQFYRIVALLALGLVLLGVAWAYQRGLRREQTR